MLVCLENSALFHIVRFLIPEITPKPLRSFGMANNMHEQPKLPGTKSSVGSVHARFTSGVDFSFFSVDLLTSVSVLNVKIVASSDLTSVQIFKSILVL